MDKTELVQSLPRKNGPEVWVLRYQESRTDGSRKLASVIVGTVEQYPTKALAQKAAEWLRLSANPDNPAQNTVSFGALVDRYIAQELPQRKSTREFYLKTLRDFVKPKWQDYALAAVKPFAVEEWLRRIKTVDDSRELAPKSKRHIRSVMHLLFDCAIRWELLPIGENPMRGRLVRIKDASKRVKKPRTLTVEEFHRLLKQPQMRTEPFRTMVIAAICLGLRCSELLGLKWGDFDWENSAIHLRRAVVEGEVDRLKTEYSEAPVPLAPALAEVFRRWMLESVYDGQEDFVFASPLANGRMPYDPSGIRENRLRQAGLAAGLGDGIGWHTFRHTYRTWLDETGAPMKVQQELMRHSDIRTTFNIYGQALSSSKREANSKVVGMVIREPRKGVQGDSGTVPFCSLAEGPRVRQV
ncbi:MAG: site-specific integrase [Terriglobales bacterium]